MTIVKITAMCVSGAMSSLLVEFTHLQCYSFMCRSNYSISILLHTVMLIRLLQRASNILY
jgi:hypothetical protein